MEFKRISIDTSKHIFTLHGVDEHDRVILRRELRRAQVEAFFTKVPPTEVALEACAGAHHWGRVLGAMGHRVKLIPPQYVKPFVKRSKNDRNDAEAISEAASRPSMRPVVKSVDEQAATIVLKHREMLVGQRTQAINALRGHAAEFGVITAKGLGNIDVLLSALADHPAIPDIAKAMFEQMGRHVDDLDMKIQAVERQLWSSTKRMRSASALRQFPASGRSPRSPWRFR